MAHFAELNENNEVIYVTYIPNDYLKEIMVHGKTEEEAGIWHLHMNHGEHRRWVQTSYNNNIRGTYAGLGYFYDEDLDAFLPPQPFPSWTLNRENKTWEPPLPMPEYPPEVVESMSGEYYWNEENQNWILG